MGFRISYAAVDESLWPRLRYELGLFETSQAEDPPESEWTFATLPDGRRIIRHEHPEGPLFDIDALTRLTEHGGTIVAVSVNETSMVSRAAHISDGWLDWRVDHDCEHGRDHLNIEGSPPPACDALLEAALQASARDAGVDVDHVFDVPVELGKAGFGYRYGYDPPAPFYRLKPALLLACLAFPADRLKDVLVHFWLQESGVAVQDPRSADWTLVELPNDCLMLVCSFDEGPLFRDSGQALREGDDATWWILRLDERHFFSTVCRYDGTALGASATHRGREAVDHLDVEGELPGLEPALAATEGTWRFHVPLDVFEAACGWGFRPGESVAYRVLEPRK